MNQKNSRRAFLTAALAVPTLMATSAELTPGYQSKQSNLKTSLNAFSFNGPLTTGSMTIDDMIAYCATFKICAVDITGYYFKGYPTVPNDEYIYHVKRLAFKNGVDISGTGVRSDFTEADPAKRKESVKLVKDWIEVAHKLGAPVIRTFAGNQQPSGHTRTEIFEWMVRDLQECVAHGKKFGVVVGLQNHDDFIKTAEHALQFVNAIKSEWFGLILDSGSYRQGDPYAEIQKTAQYAVNWQIKEKVFISGKETDVDMDKLVSIIQRSGYAGYVPLETLGDGDPKPKIAKLLSLISNSINKS